MKLLYKQLEKKKKILLSSMIFLIFIYVAANSFAIILLSIFIDILSNYQTGMVNEQITIWEKLLSWIYNNENTNINQKLFILLGLIIGIVSFSFTLRIIVRTYLTRLTMGMLFSLRNNLYNHILYLHEDSFNKIAPTSIINRLNSDMYLLQESAINYYMYFYEYVLYIVINIIFGVTLNPLLSTIYLLIIPLGMLVSYLTQKYADRYYEKNLVSLDSTNQIVRENILGIRIVKAFNLQKHQYNRFSRNNKDWLKTIVKAEIFMMLAIILLYVLLNISIIGILIFGGFIQTQNLFGGLTVGVIVAFINYIFSNIFCVYGLTSTLLGIYRTKPVIRRIKEIQNSEVEDLNSGIILENFVPKIEFKNINFSYEKDPNLLNLKNINLTINSKQTIGIIGQTGSGKTTLVSLIARLYEPLSGTLEISDCPVKELNLNYLRNNIGYAFQNKLIFAGTIKSNILNGNKNANEEEIKRASTIACANEFIENLPLKYNNPINQHGSNLSGGQKQRLSLARALIRNPKILILDDTLSALDNLTRNKVLNNLKIEYCDATKIIVSQQVKSIKHADTIIVMHEGEIVAQGTHIELLKNSELYKKINDSQQTIGDS